MIALKFFYLVPCCTGHIIETRLARNCTQNGGGCCAKEQTNYPGSSAGGIGLSKYLHPYAQLDSINLYIIFYLCSQPEEAEEQISRTAKLGQLLAVLRIIFSLPRWQLTLTSYTPFVQLFYTH